MTTEPRRRSSLAGWIAGALVLLMLYVLASGPTLALAGKLDGGVFGPTRQLWLSAYRPLEYAADESQTLGKWIDWYIGLFGEWPH